MWIIRLLHKAVTHRRGSSWTTRSTTLPRARRFISEYEDLTALRLVSFSVVVDWPEGFSAHQFRHLVKMNRPVIFLPQTFSRNRARAVHIRSPEAHHRRIYPDIDAARMRIIEQRVVAVTVEVPGPVMGAHPDAMGVMGEPDRLPVDLDHLDGIEPGE